MSNEGLTERDYKILTAGFLPEEMGKLGGYPYVKRSAIHRRLRLVDRNWSNNVETFVQVIGDTVTVWGSLTLKGVTRRNAVSKNLIAYASKENGGERIGEAEYARELANTIKKATSLLIFRCAEAFEIGLYMKEKREPHTLVSVLGAQPQPQPSPVDGLKVSVVDKLLVLPENQPPAPDAGSEPPEPPKHWAHNGGGERINAKMKTLNLTSAEVLQALEPGKTLARLSETSLTEEQVSTQLDVIALAKMPGRKESPAADEGGTAMQVRGSELQVGDLVTSLRQSKPHRVMHILGDTDDGVFAEIIVWQKTNFMTITRQSFQKDMIFSIRRGAKLTDTPASALRQIEDLKTIYAASKRAAQETN